MMSKREALAAIRFQWFGTASLILDFDGYKIAIDPFISRPSVRNILRKQLVSNEDQARAVFAECQNILISHAHHDHVMDAPALLHNSTRQLFGSHNACQLVAASGAGERQVHQICAEDQFDLGPVRVEVHQGKHVHIPLPIFGELPPQMVQPAKLRDYKMDAMFSFVLEFAGVRVAIQPFHATGADIMFIMPYRSRELKKIIALESPACVIPIHWDNFFKPLENHDGAMERLMLSRLKRFKKWMAITVPATNFVLPEIGKVYCLADLVAQEKR